MKHVKTIITDNREEWRMKMSILRHIIHKSVEKMIRDNPDVLEKDAPNNRP